MCPYSVFFVYSVNSVCGDGETEVFLRMISCTVDICPRKIWQQSAVDIIVNNSTPSNRLLAKGFTDLLFIRDAGCVAIGHGK